MVRVPQYRIFEGKRYDRMESYPHRWEARHQAKVVRKTGYNARFIQYGERWYLYIRKR